MARATKPVERVMNPMYFHWTGDTARSWPPPPRANTKPSANMGVRPKRAAVMCTEEVSLSEYFEKEVEVAQLMAAPKAKSAAMAVPAPVLKLTVSVGNVTQ